MADVLWRLLGLDMGSMAARSDTGACTAIQSEDGCGLRLASGSRCV